MKIILEPHSLNSCCIVHCLPNKMLFWCSFWKYNTNARKIDRLWLFLSTCLVYLVTTWVDNEMTTFSSILTDCSFWILWIPWDYSWVFFRSFLTLNCIFLRDFEILPWVLLPLIYQPDLQCNLLSGNNSISVIPLNFYS